MSASMCNRGTTLEAFRTTHEVRKIPFNLTLGRAQSKHETLLVELNWKRGLGQSNLACTRKRIQAQVSNRLLYLYSSQELVPLQQQEA